MMYNIAIFASGNGSNAEQIVRYFENSKKIKIQSIISNKKEAFVLERAKKLHIPSVYFSKEDFYSTSHVLDYLTHNKIDYIVLAGFLWLIPDLILAQYPNKIINIHPALLPAYGGKNMYGMHVHEAVIRNKEKQSGITIHFVNERYDEGEIISQMTCHIDMFDTPEMLAAKIHALEHAYYPKVIEAVVLKKQLK